MALDNISTLPHIRTVLLYNIEVEVEFHVYIVQHSFALILRMFIVLQLLLPFITCCVILLFVTGTVKMVKGPLQHPRKEEDIQIILNTLDTFEQKLDWWSTYYGRENKTLEGSEPPSIRRRRNRADSSKCNTWVKSECSICLDRPKSKVMIPCGHCFCDYCSRRIASTCAICRANIELQYTLHLHV